MMFDGKRFTGIDPSYGTIEAYAVNKRQDGSETSMNELSVKPCNEVNSGWEQMIKKKSGISSCA